ncbi:DUF2955 domain-containing protein [Shewanella sp. Isolate8]|uniref:DUF2955 domain-containing protein n=1 Tax=Shewanella sp. Isolate8 TaxID=2908529 RepID=UPI001EFEA545|nr:DUF2955 domain-containing protein [Shewanella sp. Isolate8]MCG9747707.1 DUF2955 domain-containing protein [Shewanella sp. Isolate8]
MFLSPANPIIRLVFGPLALLFYLWHQAAPLPILAPIFMVIFLTLMPSRPPLSMMLKLLLIVLFVSLGLVFIGGLLLDSPTGYLLFCWSLLFWSFYRSHKDAKDLLSTLMLIVVIIMTIMSKQLQAPIEVLPWLLMKSAVLALILTYLSFLLFPGDEQDILPDETQADDSSTHMGSILFKTTAMTLVLAALIGIGSSQSMLIAITIGSMIKLADPKEHKSFKQNRLITTAIGILFTFPVMLTFTFGLPTWVVLGMAIFCGLQLACFAIKRSCPLSIYQLLFTNFVVLVYQIITHIGSDALYAQLVRLVSISIAVIIGGLLLSLLHHEPVPLDSSKARTEDAKSPQPDA